MYAVYAVCCGLQVVVDVTNPWKSDYAKLGSAAGPDCVVDVEGKDVGQATKASPGFGGSSKGESATPGHRRHVFCCHCSQSTVFNYWQHVQTPDSHAFTSLTSPANFCHTPLRLDSVP